MDKTCCEMYFSDISSDDEEFLTGTQLLEKDYDMFPESELSQKDVELISPLLGLVSNKLFFFGGMDLW